MRHFTAFLFFLAATAAALAQTVRWDPPGGQLGYNQVSELALVFEDCEPDGVPPLPQVDGLAFGRPSESSETSMVNFKVSRRYSLVYPVRPGKRAPVNIPAFTVPTDKGPIAVKAASYTIGDATVGRSGIALDDIASAKLEVPKSTFWVGEIIPVTYSLSAVQRYFKAAADKPSWQPAPLIAEDWSKAELTETVVRGERRYLVTQTTRAYAKEPGSFTLKPATIMANIVVGSIGFGLFSQPQIQTLQISTDPPLDLTIQPLPPPPPGFTGMVGQFNLTSKIVPTAPAVGEPVTWTLELTGVGNWPDINGLPQREVSNDFQVVQPKSKRTMKDGSLFEGTLTEDVVLVPEHAGSYTLGGVKISYFDTATGTYKTLTTDAVTIKVGPAATSPATQSAPGQPVQFSLNPSGTPARAATAPAAVPPTPPENLPRDPLPEARHGIIPFSARAVVGLCLLAAVACPLVAWLVFAALHSRETDPKRRRREALVQLARILAGLRENPADRAGLLRRWQEQVAALWEIPHAAPGAPLVHAIVTTYSKDSSSAWAALWAEADRSLHGRDAALPGDWIARAESALQAVRVPEWPPSTLFLPRNLLPFLFTLAVLFAPMAIHADEGGDAYKGADFPAAEAAWRKRLADSPADWAARHNLGLALAQQDHWAEATAHWVGAFLLAPRTDTTRWDLALGLQNSGLAPPDLVELAHGHGRYAIARLASPGEWQVILVAASLLIAAALVVLLFKGYRHIGNWARPAALGAILVAIVLAASATIGLRAYGQLAHPDVALVWKATLLRSIPTEVDSTQKTSPLSAGSIAVANRDFLGWTRLTFAGGQAGWVRTEDIVKLYR